MNKYILFSTPSAVSTREYSFVFPLAMEEKEGKKKAQKPRDFIPRKTLEKCKAPH